MVILLIVLAVSGIVASSEPLKDPSNAQESAMHRLGPNKW